MPKIHRLAAKSLAWLVTSEECESLAVGGQAVMEGVMMRSEATLSIAVRKPDGTIISQQRPWFTLLRFDIMRKAFIRGFPILLETLVNGIKALNFSAEVAVEAEGEELKPWQIALTLVAAIGFAILLFVVLPHMVTIGMNLLGFSSGLKGITFHLWDGFFKASIFIGYIVAISRLPDIHRVFEYHGAEHKVIWAYERRESELTVETSMRQSRLHPRCGTTFMLFVMAISIALHAVLVPLVLIFWTPDNVIIEHVGIVFFKLLLMIPISAIAYETIRYAARLSTGFVAFALRAPGMLLQKLTTRDPDEMQLEVAMVALHEALGDESAVPIRVPTYTKMESL